jgi:hypothetical protein
MFTVMFPWPDAVLDANYRECWKTLTGALPATANLHRPTQTT